MGIKVVTKDELPANESQINAFLSSIFNSKIEIDTSDEFVCGVLIKDAGEIIACGFVYTREMFQEKHEFIAALVGNIAVNEEYRGKGLCKRMLQQLESELSLLNIVHFFLFAYQPKIYQSSGYIELKAPIHYFDKVQRKWNTFVYRGAMVKTIANQQLDENQIIDFQGCVY